MKSKHQLSLTTAAAKASMTNKTARKYLKSGQLPGSCPKPRQHRTRRDPFAKHEAEILELSKQTPELQAKTLLFYLIERYPELLENLGIIKTHSRPHTSNDNPFSESQLKTLKYCCYFPGRFNNITKAEQFCQQFFNWYNKEHHHSGIAWLTPQLVHYHHAKTILKERHKTLMNAYNKNPMRFNGKPPKHYHLNEVVYINPPQTVSISPHLPKEKSNTGKILSINQ